jgi:Organelle biogenesis, Muted-like protein
MTADVILPIADTVLNCFRLLSSSRDEKIMPFLLTEQQPISNKSSYRITSGICMVGLSGRFSEYFVTLSRVHSHSLHFCVFVRQREWLERRRSERNAEWAAFIDKMSERCHAVDEEYASEVKRVEAYYAELEEKLKLSQSDGKPQ